MLGDGDDAYDADSDGDEVNLESLMSQVTHHAFLVRTRDGFVALGFHLGLTPHARVDVAGDGVFAHRAQQRQVPRHGAAVRARDALPARALHADDALPGGWVRLNLRLSSTRLGRRVCVCVCVCLRDGRAWCTAVVHVLRACEHGTQCLHSECHTPNCRQHRRTDVGQAGETGHRQCASRQHGIQHCPHPFRPTAHLPHDSLEPRRRSGGAATRTSSSRTRRTTPSACACRARC